MPSQDDIEFVAQALQLFKGAPKDITPEMITKLKEIKETEYQFRQDKTKSVGVRIESFDLQNQVHEILGYKLMDDKYKPKAGGGKTGGWLATDEQRSKNVDGLIKKIGPETWQAMSPFEQGTIIARGWGTVKQ